MVGLTGLTHLAWSLILAPDFVFVLHQLPEKSCTGSGAAQFTMSNSMRMRSYCLGIAGRGVAVPRESSSLTTL